MIYVFAWSAIQYTAINFLIALQLVQSVRPISQSYNQRMLNAGNREQEPSEGEFYWTKG